MIDAHDGGELTSTPALWRWSRAHHGRDPFDTLGFLIANFYVARWTGCIRVMSGFAWGAAIAPVVREWLAEPRPGWRK